MKEDDKANHEWEEYRVHETSDGKYRNKIVYGAKQNRGNWKISSIV